MIDIQIDNDYKITSDERQFILQYKKVITGENIKGKQPNPENIGKEDWVDMTNHRTVKQALIEYTRKKTLKSNCKSFEELFKLLSDIKSTISKIKDVDNLR